MLDNYESGESGKRSPKYNSESNRSEKRSQKLNNYESIWKTESKA